MRCDGALLSAGEGNLRDDRGTYYKVGVDNGIMGY